MSIHLRHGIVVPDDFDVFPIARRAAIGDVDAVVWGVFTTESREAYANGHRADVACRARGQVTSSGVTLVFTRETSGRERRMKWVSCVDVTCTNTNDDIKYTIMGEHSCSHNVRSFHACFDLRGEPTTRQTHASQYSTATKPPYTRESAKMGF